MRGTARIAATLCAGTLASCSGSGPDAAAERRQQVEENLLLAVSFEGEGKGHTVADRMKRYGVPGLSFALIDDGEIEWAAGYGVTEAGASTPVSGSTLFQAASIAKPVVAVAAMRMRDAELIDLDADIRSYLHDYVLPEGEQTPDNRVTVRNLLSHTSGVAPGGFMGYSREEAIPTDDQIVRGLPPANSPAVRVTAPPGTAVAYSGGGYTILEIAIQDVTGSPFDRAMDEWVLSVVGMPRSTYALTLPDDLEVDAALGHSGDGTVVPGGWRVHPEQAAAGLWSTATDLATFAIEVRNAYVGESDLLEQTSAVELLTEQLDGEALGFVVRDDGDAPTFQHAGGNMGYRAFMIMHIPTGDGAVFMTNSDQGIAVGREMLRAASLVYDWPDFKPVVERRVDVDPEVLGSLEGTYEFGEGVQVEIDYHDPEPALSVTFPNGDTYALVPTGPRDFVDPETGVTVDFAGTDDQLTVTIYGDRGVRVRW